MKNIELRIVAELMKNSRRSDRELAKVLNVSQPTVSRTVKRLEKDGLIREYTMIPDFTRLGYELLALTLISMKPALDAEEAKKGRETAQERVKRSPGNIIMLERGMGLNHTGVIVSFHKDYSDYMRFIHTFKQASKTKAYVNGNIESFLIDLKDEIRYRPLTLSALANHILAMSKEKKETHH